MSNQRYFAVGMKGWVEIRNGPKVPVLKISEVTRKGARLVEVPVYFEFFDSYDNRYHRYVDHYTNVKRDLNLKLKSWSGGRYFGIYKTRKFKQLSGLWVGSGKMVELTGPALINQLLEDRGKRYGRRKAV